MDHFKTSILGSHNKGQRHHLMKLSWTTEVQTEWDYATANSESPKPDSISQSTNSNVFPYPSH